MSREFEEFDTFYDDANALAQARKEAEPLTKDLVNLIDEFVEALVTRYENDGSFENGWRDAGDVGTPVMAAAVAALAHTISSWGSSETRLAELRTATEWLNEMVCREPVPEGENLLQVYGRRK